ncbi:hypothetical protein GCM10022252_19930 [Streptosporangium oxazolinicum]|uniref:Uncharacterized protein n=1 Tax=Streptosporangium oxazolinicum TaxID=909287 RepID=A0ABP8ANT3_9ACTN
MTTLKTYTVTISGTEREDGEEPYTWAVSALNEADAIWRAKNIHADNNECDRSELQVEEIFEGLPDKDCGYHWNDHRSV